MTARSTAFLTDHYELTMLRSWVSQGMADHPAAFELFTRSFPAGRRFGLTAGLDRLLDSLERFRFEADDVTWLLDRGVIDTLAAEYLTDFRFTGHIDAYPEGSLFFPESPVLTVRGRLGEGALLETLALSIFNHDSAIASAAARMVLAADGRPLLEMGSRRVHEVAAVAAARAAYVAGFTGTSNLAAGRRYGVPTIGTAAHSFMLSFRNEAEAFAAQVEAQGVGTTTLVDTYDTLEGVRTAIATVGTDLGAVRLDSGDLGALSRQVRSLLDDLGATGTKIVVTSDLDEYRIAELLGAGAPIDSFGVGTRVATGSGHPTAGFVYKLVAVADEPGGQLRPVAKRSASKQSTGGVKTARRSLGSGGILGDDVEVSGEPRAGGVAVPVVRDGEIVHRPGLEAIRDHAATDLERLAPHLRQITTEEETR